MLNLLFILDAHLVLILYRSLASYNDPETLKSNPSESAGDLEVILTTPLCAFAP